MPVKSAVMNAEVPCGETLGPAAHAEPGGGPGGSASLFPLQPDGGISFVPVLIYRLINDTYPQWIILTTPVDNKY